MLNKRVRAMLEWHFYNYEADIKLNEEKAQDITYSNLTINMTPSVGHGNRISKPTEYKAEKLFELGRDWAAVVRNTFNTFKFEPEYDIMCRLYIKKERWQHIVGTGMCERTFWFWRNRWLEVALMWAEEYNLL